MTHAHTRSTTALFLTDLHLDRTGKEETEDLLNRIRNTESNSVILTGDISDAGSIRRHLSQIASACAPRPLYFVMGNHDYYGGGFREVEAGVHALCESTENLHLMDGTTVVSLAEGIGMVGHGGWPDARAGDGLETTVENPDRWCIGDFRDLDHGQTLLRMRGLGGESAARLRGILPLALKRHRHVVVATHVPPFANAVFHKGKPAGVEYLPHFCNATVGYMMLGLLRAFPHRRVSVLAGHSHGACARMITRNLSVRVGASRSAGAIPLDLVKFTS